MMSLGGNGSSTSERLSNVTQRTRRMLMGVASIALLLRLFPNLKIKGIPSLGLEFGQNGLDPKLLNGLLAILIVYLLITFVWYAISDYLQWSAGRFTNVWKRNLGWSERVSMFENSFSKDDSDEEPILSAVNEVLGPNKFYPKPIVVKLREIQEKIPIFRAKIFFKMIVDVLSNMFGEKECISRIAHNKHIPLREVRWKYRKYLARCFWSVVFSRAVVFFFVDFFVPVSLSLIVILGILGDGVRLVTLIWSSFS